MRRILYIYSFTVIACSIALMVFSPDILSMAFSGAMLFIVVMGIVFGIIPLLSINRGLGSGERKIRSASGKQSENVWAAVLQIIPVFHHKSLDELFESYKERTDRQQKNGQLLGDIEDYINTENISIRSWNGVIVQIPGTLTGLGILGTFVGLIIGIGEIGFSSVEAALTSVQTLLNGINTAFYTSIAGVILSILFNILHRMAWNSTLRELDIFVDTFHKNIIPPVDEQNRYQEQKQMTQILEKLDRLPRVPAFSMTGYQGQISEQALQKNEKLLMPQIIEGMKKGEFIFVLQPKYDINTRKIVSAEAYVRWKHSSLGFVSPSVFLPIVEENGYITKLDEYMWDNVCQKIKDWSADKKSVVPISVNISKTDILAGDIVKTFNSLIKKYDIPPRMLELEIAGNAFMEAPDITNEVASDLRRKGFKVVFDGFDGDFVPYNMGRVETDETKLDLRKFDLNTDKQILPQIFAQAKQMSIELTVEGIESIEQISILRKNGCKTAQGYYFSKPVSQEKFLEMLVG